MDILKPEKWSAALTLESVCRSIISLLDEPAPESPLNCDCGLFQILFFFFFLKKSNLMLFCFKKKGNLLRNGDIRGFRSLARMYTRLYAQEKYYQI